MTHDIIRRLHLNTQPLLTQEQREQALDAQLERTLAALRRHAALANRTLRLSEISLTPKPVSQPNDEAEAA